MLIYLPVEGFLDPCANLVIRRRYLRYRLVFIGELATVCDGGLGQHHVFGLQSLEITPLTRHCKSQIPSTNQFILKDPNRAIAEALDSKTLSFCQFKSFPSPM